MWLVPIMQGLECVKLRCSFRRVTKIQSRPAKRKKSWLSPSWGVRLSLQTFFLFLVEGILVVCLDDGGWAIGGMADA
jgi:hypothetical protein